MPPHLVTKSENMLVHLVFVLLLVFMAHILTLYINPLTLILELARWMKHWM
jgi:ABC-type multidrug transport system permease subunit